MEMLRIFAVLALSLFVANCSATTLTTHSAVQVAGHPYKTDPNCKRTKLLGTFDERCDHPRLGYRGFSDPTIGAASGAGGGFCL
ncbi:hypothetical protein MAXJ12_24142 [Mesorhizobium alhagi CCNWXJ12-2]|uniref:Lipoprotein n=2 Tax=Allomesorhizobium alhagi TaxID=475067 RepID=H0HXA9_9HYPH|nr:hypothetical protein MAXJ12_24142 [Mesorhizobium alhagi CCNWXJ12-2]